LTRSMYSSMYDSRIVTSVEPVSERAVAVSINALIDLGTMPRLAESAIPPSMVYVLPE
jgi:hypothetical protein